MKPIFEYLDYRQYLQDFYVEKKAQGKFSFREFSKSAGFTSPVFIKLVIEGKSNLSRTGVAKLSKALGLVKADRAYFENLVNFNQAKTIDAKMASLDELKKCTGHLTPMVLSDTHFEYFSQWYHAVIRELLSMMRFEGDYEALAGMLQPPLAAAEAQKSVELLKRLELLNGEGDTARQFLSSAGISLETLAVRSTQRRLAQLAAQALDTVPPEQRDISGLSIGISARGFERAREELARCRRRLMEIAAEDQTCDRVYRVNLHLFPLSCAVPAENRRATGEVSNEK